MIRKRRSSLALAAVLSTSLLAACESLPTINEWLPTIPGLGAAGTLADFDFLKSHDCAQVSDEDVKRVNWTRVPEVNMRIRSGEFEPMIVQMKQGWPYVFRIRNRDDAEHTFTARDFFANVAMIRTTIDGVRQNETCFKTITIPPRQTAEMRLVAAVDGRFEFEDRGGPVTGLILPKGSSGVIIIEEGFSARYR